MISDLDKLPKVILIWVNADEPVQPDPNSATASLAYEIAYRIDDIVYRLDSEGGLFKSEAIQSITVDHTPELEANLRKLVESIATANGILEGLREVDTTLVPELIEGIFRPIPVEPTPPVKTNDDVQDAKVISETPAPPERKKPGRKSKTPSSEDQPSLLDAAQLAAQVNAASTVGEKPIAAIVEDDDDL